MDPLLNSHQCELNGRLLLDIARRWRATALGDIKNFFAVSHEWRCPVCMRSKQEISRLHYKGRWNAGLLCAIVEHHDHFFERTDAFHSIKGVEFASREAIASRFVRFPPTYICQDCNNADPRAKAHVRAPENFSFAPHEIATFILVQPHQSHGINFEAVEAAWEAARLSHELMEGTVRALVDKLTGAPEFQSVGDAAQRVITDLQRRRNGEVT